MSRIALSLLVMISPAFAQAQPESSFTPLLMVGGLFAVMYFIMIRPQQKRAKEQKKLLEALKVGDEVLIHSGLVGRITELGDNFIKLEVANNVEVKSQRQAIATLLPKGSYKGSLN